MLQQSRDASHTAPHPSSILRVLTTPGKPEDYDSGFYRPRASLATAAARLCPATSQRVTRCPPLLYATCVLFGPDIGIDGHHGREAAA